MSKQSNIASPTEGLMPHQQRIVDKLKKDDQEGLILMHGLGSGKTRSSIEAYKALGLPAEVVAPAALKENYRKEIKKWIGKDPKNLNIHSQQEIARNGLQGDDLAGKLLIVDEAHRMRNEGSKLYDALSKAHPEKRVLLSGTPIYNHPGDIAKLVNMASGMKLLPESKRMFEERYISRTQVPNTWMNKLRGITAGEHISLKNKDELKGIFGKYIDYHAGNSEGFPTMSSETVRVPMADKQKALYGAMMKEIPWILRKKIEMGLAPDRRELDKLIPFLTGARMISNGTYGFEQDQSKAVSPKIQKAFEYLKSNIDKDKDYKALIYSNYLDSGVNPYKKMLDEAKIPYGEFSGAVKDSVRNKLVQDYNSNKLRALIVSSAGGEGLDLKGTRLVQLLEPHFNNEKLKQVIGRAARYKSHEALSPEKRKVLVQRYLSEVSPTLLQKIMREKSTSTDEYLQNLADEKEKLNNKFLDIIKSSSALEKEAMTLSATKAILRKLRAAGTKVQRSKTISGANYDNVNNVINIKAKDNLMNHVSKNTPVQDLWHEYGHFLDRDAVNKYYGQANMANHTHQDILRRPATILEFENRANTNALNEMRNMGVPQHLQDNYANSVRRGFETYKPKVVFEGVAKKYLDNKGLQIPMNASPTDPAHTETIQKMNEAITPFAHANMRHQFASVGANVPVSDPYRQTFKPIVRNLMKRNPEMARAFRQYHSEFKEPLSLPATTITPAQHYG